MIKFYTFIPSLLNQRNLGQITTGLSSNLLEPRNLGNPDEIRNSLNNTISVMLGLITVLASVYFLFQIIIAGYTWMTAGGDSSKAADARGRITYGIMGLAIVIGAYAIIGLVTSIFGIPVFNPLRYLDLNPVPPTT